VTPRVMRRRSSRPGADVAASFGGRGGAGSVLAAGLAAVLATSPASVAEAQAGAPPGAADDDEAAAEGSDDEGDAAGRNADDADDPDDDPDDADGEEPEGDAAGDPAPGAVWLGPGTPPSREATSGLPVTDAAPEGAAGDAATPPAAELPEPDFELVLPPLLIRRRGPERTTAFFPLFYSKRRPDDRELVVGLYYLRRGEVDADVLFPIFWNVRGDDRFTLSIPPFYLHQEGGEGVHGLAPLYFVGRFGAERYTLIPPLLTFTWRNADAAFTLVTLYWRRRDRDQIRSGLFPLIWHGRDPGGGHDVVFPFFFRFRNHLDDKTVTVIPPVYLREESDRSDWGIAPVLFHGENDEGDYWTIPPLLFHFERFDDDLKIVTPLFGYAEDEGGSTFVSWLYQNHRGDTRLDAVAPLFFWHRDTRDGSSALMVTPLFWHLENPASYTTVLFPLFGQSGTRGVERLWLTPLAARHEDQRENTAVTWVFPTFQTRREPDTFIFNLHPLLYVKRAPEQNHVILPPLLVDIERPEKEERRSVAFPVFWRFEDQGEITQVALNTYYRRYREDGNMGWEFHFFPLFAFGKPRPDHHWWNILYGLVGYRRQGPYAQTQLFYVPFQTDGPD